MYWRVRTTPSGVLNSFGDVIAITIDWGTCVDRVTKLHAFVVRCFFCTFVPTFAIILIVFLLEVLLLQYLESSPT